MNSQTIEQILSCPNLPTLPAVALRVIDLTSDPNVRMQDLADTIQNDQGLAAKIVRTVNSSYYALRQPCANIQKALVMLGLSPVKSLALGFSLVSSFESRGDHGFDYVSYWRRGLYSAVGAKAFAEAIRSRIPDEAFLAALLQDIGMVAMHRAMGRQYLDVLENVGNEHRKLVKAELDALDIQHPEIGAMLAQRWKLPGELVMAVRYHERPTAAPPEHAELIRLVSLGAALHDVLTDRAPAESLHRLYDRAKAWFNIDTTTTDSIARRVSSAGAEVSRLFQLETGPTADADAILALAEQRRDELERPGTASPDMDQLEAIVTQDAHTDPLTGVQSRKGFDSAIRHAFKRGSATGAWVTLVQACLESYGQALPTDRLDLADEAILAVVEALQRAFEPKGGIICRLSKDVFAVVLSGVTPDDATGMLLALTRDLAGGAESRGVRLSTGVASAGPGAGCQSPSELLIAATKSLQGNRPARAPKAA